MALTIKISVCNTMLDAINTAVGSGGFLQIYTSAYGTKLADIPLANPAFAAAASGAHALSGVPEEDSSADAGGTAAVFQIVTSGAVAIVKGSVTATGGGGDLTIASTTIVATQPVRVTGLTETLASF